MSRSVLFIKTLSVSLVLVSLVMVLGCTSAPSGQGGIIQATPSPSAPVSALPSGFPSPAPTSNPKQSAADIQLEGNVYGVSTNPHMGIDTITFTIGLTTKSSELDLTRMKIVFSTSGTEPVILTQGTTESTSIFTTTMGNYAITSLRPGEEVEITFGVTGVPAGSKVNIELRPSAGAALPISRTVPAMLISTNILG